MPTFEKLFLAIVGVTLVGVIAALMLMIGIQIYGSYLYCQTKHPELPAVACMANLEKLGNIKVEIR